MGLKGVEGERRRRLGLGLMVMKGGSGVNGGCDWGSVESDSCMDSCMSMSELVWVRWGLGIECVGVE